MSVWTTPTTRSLGFLVTPAVWNADIVNNLIYLKTAPVFDTAVIIGAATTAGVRLDLESGTLAVREGDDSAYAPLITSVVNLPSGGSINFASGDVTITHATNQLTFAGAASGYIFNDGNVGIGVSPSYRLDVTSSAGAVVARFNQATAGKTGVIFAEAGTQRAFLSQVGLYSGTSDGNFGIFVETGYDFHVATNGSTTTKFRVGTGGDIGINATARLYLDGSAGTGNTYIAESSADRIDFTAGGLTLFRMLGISGGPILNLSNVSFGVGSGDKIYLDATLATGGGDTYLHESSVNTLQAIVGGETRMELSSNGRLVFGSTAATILDDAGLRGSLVLVQGTDGTNDFADLVMASRSVAPTVLSSYTNKGTPSARTYTRSGNALQLAMASGNYTMVTIKLGS